MITLATLKDATAQQVFDQVKTHLLTQMKKSSEDRGRMVPTCLYRANGGLKCAAGCLISDQEYHPSFDEGDEGKGTNWPALIERGIVPVEHKELIAKLQNIHDSKEVDFWEDHLSACAIQFKLEWSVVK